LSDVGAEQLCPGCLLEAGLEASRDGSQTLSVDAAGSAIGGPIETPFPRSFGDYELLEEIAHGGMGIVYKARQVSLDRIVAVKMLLFGPLASPEFVQRFRTEAAAAASLQHPNIVAIHEVGFREGQHFFAMDYVAGRSLADIVQDRPLPARRAAGYVKTIAEAIQYAHERGILHRDLKPSNVLIDELDQPRVTDFGLAKRLEKETDLTLSGQVLGSPNYMAPEQAAARRGQVGKRSDVYSLGAILYHLLTGRAPFAADTVAKTLHQVQNNEPVSPQLLNPGVPCDLATICLKCLEKEPDKRYATAQALADELGRFLNRKPILARPVGRPEKFWRWCRRNPVVATLTAAVALVFLAGFAGVTWQWTQSEKNRALADASLYAADMKLALQSWEEGNLARAQALLRAHLPQAGQEDLRGFEWRYLWKLCKDESEYSFTDFAHEVRCAAFSPDCSLLAVGSGKTVTFLDVAGRRVVDVLPEAGGWVTALAFSPTAMNVVAAAVSLDEAMSRSNLSRAFKSSQYPAKVYGGNSEIKLWNLAGKEWIGKFSGHTAEVQSIEFSPDGKKLASASWDRTVRLWDIASQRPIHVSPEHEYPVLCVAFTRDSEMLACCDIDRNLEFWDAATGKIKEEYRVDHTAWLLAIAFSPGGETLATVSNDGAISLWDFPTRQTKAKLTGHQGPVESVAFAPDGRVLATGGTDNTIRIWDVTTARQVAILRGHRAPVEWVAFTRDGQTLVSGGLDQSVKVWNMDLPSDANTLQGHTTWVEAVAFSADSNTLASVDYGAGLVKLWDIPSRRFLKDLTGHTEAARCAAFSPNGRTLASGSHDRTVKLWDLSTLKEVGTLTNECPVLSVAFSADGNTLAAAGDGLAFWDMASRQTVTCLTDDTGGVFSVAFSPTRAQVALGYSDGRVGLGDLGDRRLLALPKEHGSLVKSVAFSSDGTLLASGSDDGSVVLYDVARRRVIKSFREHTMVVHCVAFSHDNKTLASASWDGTLKLWNLPTMQLALTLRGHQGPIVGVAFSRDGSLMATCAIGQVRLWPAASPEEIDTHRSLFTVDSSSMNHEQ
jgi:WD40 repeat protein/predicted Ser/Thr protein kinase